MEKKVCPHTTKSASAWPSKSFRESRYCTRRFFALMTIRYQCTFLMLMGINTWEPHNGLSVGTAQFRILVYNTYLYIYSYNLPCHDLCSWRSFQWWHRSFCLVYNYLNIYHNASEAQMLEYPPGIHSVLPCTWDVARPWYN